jgi:RNA polymerase sigma-70 factor (ECF subfamily)
LFALRVHEGNIDETERVLSAADGDPEARAWVARTWTPSVYRFALRMLREPEDARDVTQDVMVRLLGTLDRYDASRPFSTWALSITRNACIDLLRKRTSRRSTTDVELVDDRPSPLQVTTREERADALHQALAELPPMYREVLLLYHFEHLKYTEIADALDVPIGTVMNRIFRARQKVKALFEERGIEP